MNDPLMTLYLLSWVNILYLKKLFLLLIVITLISCTQSKNESTVLQNSDSEEVTFIIELNTKENSKEDIESFTMNISNSIDSSITDDYIHI